jgi:hypothetical protein
VHREAEALPDPLEERRTGTTPSGVAAPTNRGIFMAQGTQIARSGVSPASEARGRSGVRALGR